MTFAARTLGYAVVGAGTSTFTVVNGLGMLLHQARPAFRDWTGIMPEATPALRAAIVATL